ncbi:MAG: hypothetical protein V1736_08720 [Pseudomonadota bacterium]
MLETGLAQSLQRKKHLPERRRSIRLRRSKLADTSHFNNYTIKPAMTREELVEAFSLAHDRYVQLGYMDPEPCGMRLKIQNILPSTRVFAAYHEGKMVATATLILDSPLGLPSDDIYKIELDALRAKHRFIAEGSSLVTAREFSCSNVFMLLFKIAYAYAKYAKVDDICIAVNPKHTRFYETVLLSEPIGGLRSFPSVKDAPAILERIELRTADNRFEEAYSMEEFDCDLYTFFFTANKGAGPEVGKTSPVGGLRMSPEDLRYFFVEKTSILPKVQIEKLSYIKKIYPDYDFDEIIRK